ncbi:MAG: M1 family aminopeptidase [Bryobacterales bacterium]
MCPAIAVGHFQQLPLGFTTAGTEVSVYWLDQLGTIDDTADTAGPYEVQLDTLDEAIAGTQNLVSVFDRYESVYGAYTFGDHVASVSADWGASAYGGMEHHPYWHVSQGGLSNEEIHAHEAAHGWYGDGIRIDCWEDFVLSEGTATYLSVRALELAGGPNLWADEYGAYFEARCADPTSFANNVAAYPQTCNAIDILNDPLWSFIPYAKGTCFYEDVADLIGDDVLDGVLADFYAAHVGSAAHMQDMIDAIKVAAPANSVEIDQLATDWLFNTACPVDAAARCSSHN